MEKEKILAAARNEKHRGKEYESKQATRGNLLTSFLALIVGVGLFCIECIVEESLNFGLVAVGMTAVAVQYLYEGVTVKKGYMIVLGIICSVIATFFILAFIGQVVAV